MNKIAKEVIIFVLIQWLTWLCMFALTKAGIVSDEAYALVLKAFIFSIPFTIPVLWFAIRLLRKHELIKRNNALLIKIHSSHWAHLSALVNNYIEINKLTGTKDVGELKAILEQSYYNKYKEQLNRDLQKQFPRKTRLQIEKLVEEITKIED